MENRKFFKYTHRYTNNQIACVCVWLTIFMLMWPPPPPSPQPDDQQKHWTSGILVFISLLLHKQSSWNFFFSWTNPTKCFCLADRKKNRKKPGPIMKKIVSIFLGVLFSHRPKKNLLHSTFCRCRRRRRRDYSGRYVQCVYLFVVVVVMVVVLVLYTTLKCGFF